MKKIFLALIILVVIFSVGFLFLKTNLSPVSPDSKNKIFIVNSGDSIITISNNLIKNKIIKNHFAFLTYVFLTNQKSKIQSGTFRLSPSLSTPQIVKKLTSGGVSDYWFKIIDGTRIEEIAQNLPPESSFTQKDFISKTRNKEGHLFPDSYLIPQYYTLDQTLDIIQSNFDKKFAQAKIGATNTKMTDKQVLVLASIIEHEARTLSVKQGVAGVLINRLNINMPLQSDVTVQYARDSKTNPAKYWLDLDASDITSIISPYNTYKNQGLPPSPICNPGYDSIYAAFHPTDSDYIYYLTGNDGIMYYAKTLSEHNINISKHLK